MNEGITYDFKARKLYLVICASFSLMPLSSLIFWTLDDNTVGKNFLVVFAACFVVYFLINFLWILKSPLISLRESKLAINVLFPIRKVIDTKNLSMVSIKSRYILIRLYNGNPVRLPTQWLDAAERMELEDLLLQIVQRNQDKASSVQSDK